MTEDGTLHELLPKMPVAHAQRLEIGEWSCWFNWDKPGFAHTNEARLDLTRRMAWVVGRSGESGDWADGRIDRRRDGRGGGHMHELLYVRQGDGDYEDTAHILSHYKGNSVCQGKSVV